MKKSIYIYSKFEATEKANLNSLLGTNFTLYFHDEILENMQFETFNNCVYCLGNVPLAWCRKSENLKWLQLHSAGIDPYNLLEKPDFKITNLRGYFAESVAETTLAGILAFYRGLDRLHTYQLDNYWVGQPIRASLQKLHRKKVWVLGGGSIANTFIKLITPFDCEIKQSLLRDLKVNAHSKEYFSKMAENIDILVLILPEIPELTHFINKQTLSLLSTKTLIVNSGRGSTVNTDDLTAFLQNRKLSGAVLDVTEIEPLPSVDPLWKMENVILTQHSAGGWDGENSGKVSFFVKQLEKFEKGENLENIVDCERGY
jgi:glyoxylate/hydroxypyruvate reductase